MSYKDRLIGRAIYSPVSKNPPIGGMKQYRVDTTNELSGRVLEIHLDGMAPVLVRFLDGVNLMWARHGEAFRWDKYEACKSDENLFIIKTTLENISPVTHATLIWDESTTLVTCVIGKLGEDRDHPRLVRSQVYFGAQKLPHTPLATARHEYTEDLVGKRVIWHYNPNDEIMHVYGGKNYLRLGHSEKRLVENPDEAALAHYNMFVERGKTYPEYEEPAWYVKIREGFYLYSVTERNIHLRFPKQGGNQLLILLNALRVRYIGCVFGYHADGTIEDDFIGAVGKFCPVPDEVENLPYPLYPEP